MPGLDVHPARTARTQRRFRRRCRIPIICLALSGAFVLASCSSSQDSGSRATGGASDSSPSSSAMNTANEPTLTVAIGSNGLNYAPFFVALAKNLFVKNGVKVDVQSANAVATIQTLLVSNQIDLGMTSPSQILVLAAAGKPINIVSNVNNYTGRSAAFVTSSKITSFDQLKAKGGGCTITTTAAGTVLYAYAKRAVEAYGLKCAIATVASNPLVLSAITAGLTDAVTLTVNDAQTATAKGAQALLDPTTMSDAQADSIVPSPLPAIVVAGLPETLKSKSAAVVSFLAAMREATRFIESNPPAVSANLIVSQPYFSGLTVDQLTASIQALLTSFPTGSDLGQISQGTWEQTLATFASYFDLPGFDPTATTVQYPAMVDMNFLEKIPK